MQGRKKRLSRVSTSFNPDVLLCCEWCVQSKVSFERCSYFEEGAASAKRTDLLANLRGYDMLHSHRFCVGRSCQPITLATYIFSCLAKFECSIKTL